MLSGELHLSVCFAIQSLKRRTPSQALNWACVCYFSLWFFSQHSIPNLLCICLLSSYPFGPYVKLGVPWLFLLYNLSDLSGRLYLQLFVSNWQPLMALSLTVAVCGLHGGWLLASRLSCRISS